MADGEAFTSWKRVSCCIASRVGDQERGTEGRSEKRCRPCEKAIQCEQYGCVSEELESWESILLLPEFESAGIIGEEEAAGPWAETKNAI